MTSVAGTLAIGQCNCFTLRKAARRISRLYDSYLQPTGLRITQFLILATLAEIKSASVNALADHLDLERTAMGKTLGPLERDGLLRISPSPSDGRSRIAVLTPKGRRVFDKAEPHWRAAQNRLIELNGEHWTTGLRSTLSRMVLGDHPSAAVGSTRAISPPAGGDPEA